MQAVDGIDEKERRFVKQINFWESEKEEDVNNMVLIEKINKYRNHHEVATVLGIGYNEYVGMVIMNDSVLYHLNKVGLGIL